jgi:methylthioribose-1-phosphate isomerase
MLAALLSSQSIDAAIVGADRIVGNGDTANKIGTLQLAILAREFGVPFYVAAPESTIDRTLHTGKEIEIEQRPGKEITHPGGTLWAPEGASVWNPAFDVTPGNLIDAIVTEIQVYRGPYNFRKSS